MTLWLHEISESGHRILNPFTEDKLLLVGAVSRLGPGTRLLDLACGKGELLCRFAREYGTSGHGVDLSEVFLAAAHERADELGVTDRVTFEHGDAGTYAGEPRAYDVGCCIGATWIGNGLAGTIELLRPAVRPDGLLLIGEPYWTEPPPDRAAAALGLGTAEFVTLAGTLDRFEAAGVDLVEMVLADGDSWDRYAAAQWWTTERWLRGHADDPRAPQVRRFLADSRRSHLEFGRRYLGWGVFVLRV
jgi:SAM-dependent methyltransferase